MTSGRTRRLAAASFALTAALGLSACGVGLNAQTSQQYQPGIGANLREGDVQLYNALLVQNTDGTLSFSAGLVNETEEEQTLVSASFAPLEGGAPVSAEPSTDIVLAPRSLFTIGTEGELAGIEGDGLVEGRFVVVTLEFEDAGEVTLEAPIVARSEMYSSVAAEPAQDPEEATPDEQEAPQELPESPLEAETGP